MTARLVRALAVTLATVGLGGAAFGGAAFGGAGAAAADDGSALGGALYLADANTGADLPVGGEVTWDRPVIALAAPGDQESRLVAPEGTESVVSFVGPADTASDPSTWNATAPWEYTAPGQWLADVTPYHLVTPGPGDPSGTNALAAASGEYVLGVAYLADDGTRVLPGGLYLVRIHLTGDADPARASYTWEPVDDLAAGATSAGAGVPAVPWAAGLVVVAGVAGWALLHRRRGVRGAGGAGGSTAAGGSERPTSLEGMR